MPTDLIHAIIQLPLATAVAIAYFREAFTIDHHNGSAVRIWCLMLLGAIAGGFVGWRLMVVFEAVPPDYRMDGGQLAQTTLLIGIAIAYYLLKEPRRKT